MNRSQQDDAKAAHAAVHRALRRGELVKPPQCGSCGKRPGPDFVSSVIHAHHEDYSRPLDVMWLCGSCHIAAHAPRARRADFQDQTEQSRNSGATS